MGRFALVLEEVQDVFSGERAVLSESALHLLDYLGGFVYVFGFAADDKFSVASGDSYAEVISQQSQVGIGWPEQFELLFRRIDFYSYLQALTPSVEKEEEQVGAGCGEEQGVDDVENSAEARDGVC